MSDFRKTLLAFAGAAVLAASVSAQPITCSTTAQPLTVRSEGLAELLGDVLLNCIGGAAVPAGATVPSINISVTLSVPVASRIVNATNLSLLDVFLLIDDPMLQAPGASLNNQNNCGLANGNCGLAGFTAQTAGGAAGTVLIPPPAPPAPPATPNIGLAPLNVFQAYLQNANTVTFLNVPILSPNAGAPNATNRTFRIKNLRGSINGNLSTGGQVQAFLQIQNPPANLQLNSNSGIVGFVQTGLIFSRQNTTGGGPSALSLNQCDGFNSSGSPNLATSTSAGFSTTNGGRTSTIRFAEGYGLAFKVRGFPGLIVPPATVPADQFLPTINYDTESGFYNSQFTGVGAPVSGLPVGAATNGTRLRATFSGIPTNVRVFVSVQSISPGALLVPAVILTNSVGAFGVVTDANGSNASGAGTQIQFPTSVGAETLTGSPQIAIGGVPPFTGLTSGLTLVPVAAGATTASFTWEVFSATSAPEQANFAVALAFASGTSAGFGTLGVAGSLAPVSTVTGASGTAPIPRFADTGAASNVATLTSCQTNLLFPFVTNVVGFDTGMAISNTSSDPFGTTTQSGNCTVYYFGQGQGGGAAPASQTTTSMIGGGQVLLFTLSGGGTNGITATPGFQGYIIANCGFRFAHGLAFISDPGARNLALGYLALIMDVTGGRTGVGATEAFNN